LSIDRQFGVHEIPGTEEPAPQPRAASAGFEAQMREYVNAIWAKIAALEGRLDDFEGWRTVIALALKDATGIDPRNPQNANSRPMLVSGSGAKGERPRPVAPPKPDGKPWLAEGVSKATWYRRQKGAA
jgi:hypothetical protein